MNAVESLRRRVAPGAVARSLGYAPLSFSDDGEDTVDDVGGGYELGGIRGEYSGEVGEVGVRRQARRRHDDDLRPHYTPLYLNVKVQRRKVLDASSAERRIGPCEGKESVQSQSICSFLEVNVFVLIAVWW